MTVSILEVNNSLSLFTVVDLVLIMSVNPGFGGQSFIESQVKKISELRRLCAEKVQFPSSLAFSITCKHFICFVAGSEPMDRSGRWSRSWQCVQGAYSNISQNSNFYYMSF